MDNQTAVVLVGRRRPSDLGRGWRIR